MRYYLTLINGIRGAGITPDGTFPTGAVECTLEQYQNPGAWTVQNGKIVAYTPPAPTLSQQAASLLASGLTITSTSTPELNGTYIVASRVPFGREDIANEAQFISTFSEFTNGTTTLDWPLIDGTTFVTFPSTTEFLAFAKAAARFYAACSAVKLTNSGTLPSASVTIA